MLGISFHEGALLVAFRKVGASRLLDEVNRFGKREATSEQETRRDRSRATNPTQTVDRDPLALREPTLDVFEQRFEQSERVRNADVGNRKVNRRQPLLLHQFEQCGNLSLRELVALHQGHERGDLPVISKREKIRIEIGVSDHFVEPAVRAILEGGRTGDVGDGKVFVLPVEKVYRIRTGEEDQSAVTPLPPAAGEA